MYQNPYAPSQPYAPPQSQYGQNQNLSSNQAMGQGVVGAGLGALDMMMYKNPSNAANQYYNQIPNEMGKYLNPYINAGTGALNNLQGQYSNLMNNPGGMVNQMGQQFHQSPGFQFSVDQATGAANRAAAAGGYQGSPAEQQALAGNVTGMANQDYYNWLHQAQSMYGMGLQGEQGIAQLGYGASTDMADSMGALLMSQANNAYAGTSNQNQNREGGWGAIAGSLDGSMMGSSPGSSPGSASGMASIASML